MKTLNCFILILGLSSFLQGKAQNDPVAEKYLDALARKTQSIQPFRITFTFTTLDLQDNSESSYEGSLLLQQKMYVLKTGDTEVYFDGKTLWNFLPEENEVNITNPDPEDHSFFADPGRLFSGYKEQFKYKYIDKQVAEGKSLLVIDLYPIDLEEPYSRIRLEVDETSMLLASAHYFGKGGIHYIIKIRKTEPNIKVTPGDFSFDPAKHPDIEVIDLRDL